MLNVIVNEQSIHKLPNTPFEVGGPPWPINFQLNRPSKGVIVVIIIIIIIIIGLFSLVMRYNKIRDIKA